MWFGGLGLDLKSIGRAEELLFGDAMSAFGCSVTGVVGKDASCGGRGERV